MITLYIDTSSNKQVHVGLQIGKKRHSLSSIRKMAKAQEVLPLIDKLLKKKKLNISDIDSIKVNTGPGSFTGLRVGISVANALSYFLKIPINGKKIGELELPYYYSVVDKKVRTIT